MPGISPRRIRGSERVLRRRGSFGSAPRSSFGARLRTRCPQYGHSVTYGLTSDPQFLQTTKRSGCDTPKRGYPAGIGGPGRPTLHRRLLDDAPLPHTESVLGIVDTLLSDAPLALL